MPKLAQATRQRWKFWSEASMDFIRCAARDASCEWIFRVARQPPRRTPRRQKPSAVCCGSYAETS